MVLAADASLRDVIAFPKTQRGQDLLMDAPSPVDERQLASSGSGSTLRLPERRSQDRVPFLRFHASVPMDGLVVVTSRRPELVRQSLSV